jgi:hypothetical protein
MKLVFHSQNGWQIYMLACKRGIFAPCVYQTTPEREEGEGVMKLGFVFKITEGEKETVGLLHLRDK